MTSPESKPPLVRMSEVREVVRLAKRVIELNGHANRTYRGMGKFSQRRASTGRVAIIQLTNGDFELWFNDKAEGSERHIVFDRSTKEITLAHNAEYFIRDILDDLQRAIPLEAMSGL